MASITVRDGQFWDEHNRNIQLRGINLSGDSKLPRIPDMPSHRCSQFFETSGISFVGRPFPLQDADDHLARIASWGYNVVRFVITWEAVEPTKPGVYDEQYIEYVIEILDKCALHNLFVIMDPHQDVWSRFSGGSGAPYWTYIAAVHNTSEEIDHFPRMIWSTNYDRLAAATMFILFFAGKHYAPKAILNDQNIEDYLQSHFLNAMALVARRIQQRSPSRASSVVLGWETMNEPSMSWLGRPDLSIIPQTQHLRKATCPTPYQAMLTGSGIAQEIEVWDFSTTGPKHKGSTLVDPKGMSVWLTGSKDDENYGWRRAEDWKLGTCIWAQHGVWDVATGRLLRPDYFLRGTNGAILDDAATLQSFWMPHFRKFKSAIRAESPKSIIFCQPPVLKIPPVFNELDRQDDRIVYSPHFYDGLTLMNKTWNTWYNVDVLGVLRGRYRSPIFAVKFGLRAIRNCLSDQLLCIKKEGLQNLGNYPCLFSEIGIPFDLDGGKAFRNNDYTSQIGAMDANNFALEGANVHFTFWHYSILNTNKRGDFWNGEDLSFVSVLDQEDSEPSGEGNGLDKISSRLDSRNARAALAFIRPAAVKTAGKILHQSFDLKTRVYKLTIVCSTMVQSDEWPSIIFVPKLQFQDAKICTNDGKAIIDVATQYISWWHEKFSEGSLSTLEIREGRPN